MANPTASLARYISWPGLSEVLDLSKEPLKTAMQTHCQFCRKPDLWAYADRILGGTWWHCRACHFAGDSVELCARIWGADIDDTLLRLQLEGILNKCVSVTDETVGDYLRD